MPTNWRHRGSCQPDCRWSRPALGSILPTVIQTRLPQPCAPIGVLPYATDLILQFNPAVPPLHQAIRMLEQVATEIAPQLGWQPSEPEIKPIELFAKGVNGARLRFRSTTL